MKSTPLLPILALWACFSQSVHGESPQIENTYCYEVPDSGSMRPAIWDGDTVRVWLPALRPWHYDRSLLGKIVKRRHCSWSPTGECVHRIVAITPQGAVTRGDNCVGWEGEPLNDPGFMAKNGSDYGGEVTIDVHNPNPGKQRRHSFERL